MSQVFIEVPQLSESVSEATLLEWKKNAGDSVLEGEIVIEIETDKVVLEVPAPSCGVLTEIRAPSGATVTAGQVIAVLDAEAHARPPETPAAEKEAPAQAASDMQAAIAAAKENAGRAPDELALRVMPSAVRALAQHNIAAGAVRGTGPGGRITKTDVLLAVNAAAPVKNEAAASAVDAPEVKIPVRVPRAPAAGRGERREPMSRLRARMAERLLESLQTTAQLTTFNEVDMSAVIALRTRYKEKFEKTHGVRLGFMSFFVKAAAYALMRHPILNASIEGDEIVYHDYVDIGVAVGSERGLVVPVVRNAHLKSFHEIELEIADFAKRASAGKLTLEELSGGTFTVSNGGVFGSMLSTPIINPPQSGILGIHATRERAVVVNGEIVVRPINYLALSYDHRIIDGREAVLSLAAMKDALEDPARMLLDI